MIEHFYLLTTLVLGLFAGSLLTEAMILVPYWRRMKPVDFFRLHENLGPNLFRYYAPLTAAAVTLSVMTAAITSIENTPWLISAGLCLITLAIFFIYFRTANNRFASKAIQDDALHIELNNWSRWHWVRTALAVLALAASIYGHSIRSVI